MAYDPRTGKQLSSGSSADVSGVDPSLIKYDANTGKALSGGASSGGGGTATTDNNEFLKTLQEALMGQSGVSSSETGKIDKSIEDAINTVKGGQESSAEGIKAFYERQRNGVQDQLPTDVQNYNESRSGFATNMAALKNIFNDTDKALKDLDLREQEALSTGNSDAAAKIADLKLQQLQFRNQAQQQSFQNLLATSSFALNVSQQKTQEAQFDKTFGLQSSAQDFAENKAMSDIALTYGVELKQGDTLDTLIARAKPYASEIQKLALEQTRAQIESLKASASASRANAAESIANANGKGLDAATIESVAKAYRITGGAVLGQLKNTADIASVINRANELEASDITTALQKDRIDGVSKSSAIADLSQNQTIQNKAQALSILESVYASLSPTKVTKNPIQIGPSAPLKAPRTADQIAAQKAANEAKAARNRQVFGSGF